MSGGGGGCVETLGHWRRGGSLEDFRGGYGQIIHDSLHPKVGLLEFVCNCPKEGLEIGGGGFETADVVIVSNFF